MCPEEKEELRNAIMAADATEEEYKEIAGWVIEAGQAEQTRKAFQQYIYLCTNNSQKRKK